MYTPVSVLFGIAVCLSFWTCFPHGASGLAVMSVDLGTEYIKVAIVSPGVPMEIVLNKESKRKTPVAMSFRGDDREFGENAVTLSTRFPEKVYRFLLGLVGKSHDSPAVNAYQKTFSYHKLISDDSRNTVLFQHNEGGRFSVEELLAMILEKARDFAVDFSGQPIKDAVITVPPFFNQAERRAVRLAAELADLKLLQLMNDNAAVALNYGIFRRKDFNATTQRIMFFDMGAGSTKVTIVGYQVVKLKEKGYVEETPQLNILGLGYDRTLGGLQYTLRLRDHLAKKFNEQKLTSTNVLENARAMTKLLKEAERLKMVLSANVDHVAQVEGLLDDKDFKQHVSRGELEEMSEDLFRRIEKPIKDALRAAQLDMGDIEQVILVGAATRMPRVQEEIIKVVKKPDLGKSLNTDEAAAMGAVYQAAHLSQGFKVKRFVVKEAVQFPIQVSFERELEPKEGAGVKQVTRTLFGLNNAFPQKKVMTFNRHVKDFELNINYGDLSFMEAAEREYFGSSNISKISLIGVTNSLQKHADDSSEYKGVKAHFRMDESGLLNLDQVECVFEKTVPDVQPEEEDTESTLSKLGNTFSKLFSSMGQTDEAESTSTQESTGDSDSAEEQSADAEPAATVTPGNETQGNASESAKNETVEEKKEEASSQPKNETNTTEKTKVVATKESMKVKIVTLDIQDLDADARKASLDKLKEYKKKEREKHELEEAHNALESFLIETKDKLYQAEYESASTEEERKAILDKLTECSDWLDEESGGATAKVYKEKLSSLKSVIANLFDRVREHRDRPEAVTTLKDMLNASRYFLERARNSSEEEQYFTDVELDMLDKLIKDTGKWLEEKGKDQAELELHKNPILTLRSLAEKIAALDREVKYMLNKARNVKPKPKKSKNESEGKGDASEANATKTDTTPDDSEKVDEKEKSGEPVDETLKLPDVTEETSESTPSAKDEQHEEL